MFTFIQTAGQSDHHKKTDSHRQTGPPAGVFCTVSLKPAEGSMQPHRPLLFTLSLAGVKIRASGL